MSAIAAAPCSATRSLISSTSPGFAVTREYYVNDAGAQVDALARSAYLRYREALGETIGEIPEGLYPGDYLKPVGRALVEQHGKELLALSEPEWLPIVRDAALRAMLAMIEQDLAELGIRHDVFFSERSLIEGPRDQVAETIAELKAKGLIYMGSLPPPKGKVDEDWEDREQLLFRSTAFGDDMDRPSSNRMAATPISQATWPITATSSDAALTP